jgi:quinol monooxygenase YgiN
MNIVSKVAFFAARKGRERHLGERLLPLVSRSRSEPGNLRYEVLQDTGDDGIWIVLEDWCSEVDFDGHMATPYVCSFLAEVPDLCDGDPDIRSYRKRSPQESRHQVRENRQ